MQILKGFSQKLTELPMKVFYKWIVIKIKYSDGCGLLAGLTEFVWKLNPWFTTLVYISSSLIWTFNKISPKRSLENLTSDDLRSLKLCFYASWLPNCWKNCHLPWGVYSVPKKHPLGHVDLLNFGSKTIIEIWSFSDRSWQRSTHCSHKMLSSWSPMFY